LCEFKISTFYKSEENDIIVYEIKVASQKYLAVVEYSCKKLLIIRDYYRYIQDLDYDQILEGENEYNIIKKLLKQNDLINNS